MSPQIDPKTFLDHPDFLALPPEERRKVMIAMDPEFPKDRKEQNAILGITTAGTGRTGPRLKGERDLTTEPPAFPQLAKHVGEPGWDNKLGALSGMLGELAQGASPALWPAFLANPTATLAGLGLAMGAKGGASSAGEAVGLPGTGEFVGDLLTIPAAKVTGDLRSPFYLRTKGTTPVKSPLPDAMKYALPEPMRKAHNVVWPEGTETEASPMRRLRFQSPIPPPKQPVPEWLKNYQGATTPGPKELSGFGLGLAASDRPVFRPQRLTPPPRMGPPEAAGPPEARKRTGGFGTEAKPRSTGTPVETDTSPYDRMGFEDAPVPAEMPTPPEPEVIRKVRIGGFGTSNQPRPRVTPTTTDTDINPYERLGFEEPAPAPTLPPPPEPSAAGVEPAEALPDSPPPKYGTQQWAEEQFATYPNLTPPGYEIVNGKPVPKAAIQAEIDRATGKAPAPAEATPPPILTPPPPAATGAPAPPPVVNPPEAVTAPAATGTTPPATETTPPTTTGPGAQSDIGGPVDLEYVKRAAERSGHSVRQELFHWLHEGYQAAYDVQGKVHSQVSDYIKNKFNVKSMRDLTDEQALTEYRHLNNIAHERGRAPNLPGEANPGRTALNPPADLVQPQAPATPPPPPAAPTTPPPPPEIERPILNTITNVKDKSLNKAVAEYRKVRPDASPEDTGIFLHQIMPRVSEVWSNFSPEAFTEFARGIIEKPAKPTKPPAMTPPPPAATGEVTPPKPVEAPKPVESGPPELLQSISTASRDPKLGNTLRAYMRKNPKATAEEAGAHLSQAMRKVSKMWNSYSPGAYVNYAQMNMHNVPPPSTLTDIITSKGKGGKQPTPAPVTPPQAPPVIQPVVEPQRPTPQQPAPQATAEPSTFAPDIWAQKTYGMNFAELDPKTQRLARKVFTLTGEYPEGRVW